jgi:hypothetical protein
VYITVPDVLTSSARFYLIASDSYGHQNYFGIPNEGYFNIGAATQTVDIPQGWSGLSSAIVPMDNSLSGIFSNYLDNVIIVQDLEKVFWPGGNVFTLTNWDVFQGYMVKSVAPFLMEFTGSSIECAQYASIPEGWGLIPVVGPCDIDAAGFMNMYLWSSEIIKEAAGWRIFWPQYNIHSLQILERGKSYFVYSTMENTDFSFGPCWEEVKASFNHTVEIPECWNEPVYTPVSHVFAIPEDVLNEAGIGMDWTIGAFSVNGLCVGVAPTSALHLTAFADDPSTESPDGLRPGEPVHFRTWNPHKQKEIDLTAEFVQHLPNQGNFAENGTSVIESLKLGTTGIDQLTAVKVYLYPNPATDRLMIEITLTGKYQVEISDTKGSVLIRKDLNGNTSLDISSLAGGVFSVKITDGNTIIIRKLLVY